MLRAFVNHSSKRLFSFHFIHKHCLYSGFVDFRMSARFRQQDGGGGGGGGVSLKPARIERLPPRLGGLASGFAFYQFGIMASS